MLAEDNEPIESASSGGGGTRTGTDIDIDLIVLFEGTFETVE